MINYQAMPRPACAKAISEKNSLDASLYCDLATFLSYEKSSIFGSAVAQSGVVSGADNNALTMQPVNTVQ